VAHRILFKVRFDQKFGKVRDLGGKVSSLSVVANAIINRVGRDGYLKIRVKLKLGKFRYDCLSTL
jgi:hypothetical protein